MIPGEGVVIGSEGEVSSVESRACEPENGFQSWEERMDCLRSFESLSLKHIIKTIVSLYNGYHGWSFGPCNFGLYHTMYIGDKQTMES